MLRKDFTVSPYQIYEAKVLGADAVLLICAILSASLKSGAKIIGINNRNLKDFTVDIGACLQLRKEIPEDRVCIAESGIQGANDIRALKERNFNGVLIGETLMRSGNPEEMLGRLKEA